MPNPHGSFIWYELVTPDPDAAKAFYDAVVGWTVEPRPSGEIDYRMIDTGQGLVGGMVRLTEQMTAGGARPGWLGYIGVDDVDATVAALTHAGGAVHLPPFDIPGIGRIAVVADPQGAVFDVMRPASSDGISTAFAPQTTGHVAWNELTTSDQADALAFYGALFGWESKERMSMGPMGEYIFLDHHDQRLGATALAQGEWPVRWLFYFRVPDIDAAAERIGASGGQVTMGPHPVPTGDRIVIASDPHGTAFALVGPGKQ